MLGSTSSPSHCGEAELTWLKMLIRFLWIDAPAWPVNSDNPSNRVRGQGDEVMFTWWAKELAPGSKQWERSGSSSVQSGWGRWEDGQICVWEEQRRIKLEIWRKSGGYVCKERRTQKPSVKWDGRAMKEWAEGRNVLTIVSLFFWSVCFVCVNLCVYKCTCMPSWVWAYLLVVAFAFCLLAHVDLRRLPCCLCASPCMLMCVRFCICASVCRCVCERSGRRVWQGAVQ